MSALNRTFPLTPAMRAALGHSTTGMARRSLLTIFGALLFIYAILWMVSRSEPAEAQSFMQIGTVFVLGMGAFLLIFVGLSTGLQQRKSASALHSGTFRHHTGAFRMSELTINRTTRHNLFVNGIKLELEYFVVTDVPRLMRAASGTVLFVPESSYLLAAWDQEGVLLYTAPDYHLDGDPDAPRPAGVSAPTQATTRPLDLTGRLTALLNPLARSTVAMIALGVALLVLAIVGANSWSLLP